MLAGNPRQQEVTMQQASEQRPTFAVLPALGRDDSISQQVRERLVECGASPQLLERYDADIRRAHEARDGAVLYGTIRRYVQIV
jgi:hypothetical protein